MTHSSIHPGSNVQRPRPHVPDAEHQPTGSQIALGTKAVTGVLHETELRTKLIYHTDAQTRRERTAEQISTTDSHNNKLTADTFWARDATIWTHATTDTT